MTRAVFDTNVILDVGLARERHLRDSLRAIELVAQGRVEGFLPGHGVTTIYYFLRKNRGPGDAARMIGWLLDRFQVAGVDEATIRRALELDFPDFEDAVVYASAEKVEADVVVTRDASGFPTHTIAVLSPQAFVSSH